MGFSFGEIPSRETVSTNFRTACRERLLSHKQLIVSVIRSNAESGTQGVTLMPARLMITQLIKGIASKGFLRAIANSPSEL